MARSSIKSFSSFATFALAALLPSALAAIYDVQVGPDGRFIYDPPYVNAVAGDVVNFIFNPKNHTVTQSSFNEPCVAALAGLNSGFIPVAADTDDPRPTFQIHVLDNSPKWFYCQQGNHCGSGMVFALNPGPEGSQNSFEAFRQNAIAINGAPAATPAPAPTATYVTPPPPQWQTATATITYGGSVWTTTYTSYQGSLPPSPAPEPVNHKILVGDGGSLAYDPPSIPAAVGDTVTFEFRAKNHTVTQSTFMQPCVRSVDAVTGEPGFTSGFQPVAAGATQFPTFTITINDTAPIWGYCGQPGHCGAGMVFAINAIESGANNFAAFQGLAKMINGTSPSTGSGNVASFPPSGSGVAPTGGEIDNDESATAASLRPMTGIVAAVVGVLGAWAL